MNMNMSENPRMLLNRLSPAILAVVSFLLVRIVNGDDYLSHSILFIAVELVMAVGMSYLLCYGLSRWAEVVKRRDIPVVWAYLRPVVLAAAAVIVMVVVSHGVAYAVEGVPFSMGEIEVPIVIVSLITVWLYAYYESILIERKYQELRLKNEQISDEMRYLRNMLGVGDRNERDECQNADDVIVLKAGRVSHRVSAGDIILVEGMENYLKVYTNEGVIITRSSMKGLLGKLPGKVFMQVHRSYIVNLTHVVNMAGNVLQLRHDYCAPVSRSMKGKLREVLDS